MNALNGFTEVSREERFSVDGGFGVGVAIGIAVAAVAISGCQQGFTPGSCTGGFGGS